VYNGTLKLKTAPTQEVVSAANVKVNSRIDSNTYSGNIAETPSINVASYSTGTQTGTGVSTTGASEVVGLLIVGTLAGTVTANIEDSDDDATYYAVTGSTFAVVTAANDNAVYEKAYTGDKKYVRVVGLTCSAAGIYGAMIQLKNPESDEDSWIEDMIATTRQYAESISDRSFLTQSHYLYLPQFPSENYIEIPRPPLQTINSIKYTDDDGTVTTLTTDYYNYDTKSQPGRVYLEDDKSWPSFTEYPFNAVEIDFTAGSTSLASFKESEMQTYHWIMASCSRLYEDREKTIDTLNCDGLPRNLGFK
jgi:uncharacterized phiE125 gp8 family phage protein